MIYNAAGNAKLTNVAGNLRADLPFPVLYLKDFSNAEEVLKEHRAILKAMQEKDAELAGKLAEEHIVHQQETIIQRMEKK